MSIVTTANVTRVTSTDVTIQWGASTPIKWVGYKFSGDADYTEIYNDLTNVGKLSDYFVINQLTASTSYTVTVKMISVTGTVETTDYPVVSFTTPAAGSLAASLKAKLIGNDTVLVIWETNIGLTGLSYTINSGAAVQVPVTAGLTSNSFYIEDIENDDVLVVQFTNSTLVQTLSLTIIISSEDSIGLDEDRTLPAIPVDMSDLLFPYIYFDPLERPRGIITALEWNTLARLLIHQGNYTAKALNQLDLSILQTDPYAVMIKATQIDPGDLSANNVQAKLGYLKTALEDVVLGQIPNNTITEAKLENTYSSSLAKKDDTLQTGLNAEKLGGSTLADIIGGMLGNLVEIGTYTSTSSQTKVNGVIVETPVTHSGVGDRTHEINLGFRPKAVLIFRLSNIYSSYNTPANVADFMMTFAISEDQSYRELWCTSTTGQGSYAMGVHSISDNGFIINDPTYGSSETVLLTSWGISEGPYMYIAIK